jgi:hypothetical protein
MANVQLNVEFRDEKKIVTHPNGSVSEYPKTVLENHKQHLLERKQMLEDQIAGIDKDLGDIETAKVEAAKVKPAGEENLG